VLVSGNSAISLRSLPPSALKLKVQQLVESLKRASFMV